MFQQDYLMRLIWQFVEAMRRTVEKDDDPDAKAASVEDAIANALEMDANVVLGLAPESFAGILSVSGTDPHVVEYLVRGMALESYYLEQAGKQQAAQLRFDQACALAAAYGIEAPAAGEIPVMNDFDGAYFGIVEHSIVLIAENKIIQSAGFEITGVIQHQVVDLGEGRRTVLPTGAEQCEPYER